MIGCAVIGRSAYRTASWAVTICSARIAAAATTVQCTRSCGSSRQWTGLATPDAGCGQRPDDCRRLRRRRLRHACVNLGWTVAGLSNSLRMMITLTTQPRLEAPTATVRASYLTGEQADCLASGFDTGWLGPASEDFDGYVASCQGVQRRWDVPFSTYWYIAEEHYLGTLVIRHELTPALLGDGGHMDITCRRRGGDRGTPPGCLPPAWPRRGGSASPKSC